MTTIQQAIEKFRASRKAVYLADQDELIRNANSAAETAQDHVGRWLYELIQNSDDAKAKKIFIKVTESAIYVCDNGSGLMPETIKSLSGTHLSVKPAGCIGRKGLGFKSVYAISSSPHIFSDEDGLIFCPERAQSWIRENKLPDSKIPYQWLPFWISRSSVANSDSALAGMKDFRTIVKLPINAKECVQQTIESLDVLPAYALMTFRNLIEIEVDAGDKSFSVFVEKPSEGKAWWTIADSRLPRKQLWLRSSKIIPTPPKILAIFNEADRDRVREVSLLVATLVSDKTEVAPVGSPINLHVYYPTEEPSPIPVLLHADFVVKSDRTRIIASETNAFNAWVAEQLADHIIQNVDAWYSTSAPAANLQLLLPKLDSESNTMANRLWSLIEQRAKTTLRLPNRKGERVLGFSEACVVATSIDHDLARQIFESGEYKDRLVHKSIQEDTSARKVAIKLGCYQLSDQDLLNCISEAPSKLKNDHVWLWKCWHWVAAWAAKNRKEYQTDYLETLKKLPVIPILNDYLSVKSLGGRIVTWRDEKFCSTAPEWLPLRFLENWFRDEIVGLAKDHPIRSLLTELQIAEPSDGLMLKALATDILSYWQNKQGDPARFINFLTEGDFHERFNLSDSHALLRCPIPARIEGKKQKVLIQARLAYFGSDWGEVLLAELFEGVPGVAWADRPKSQAEKYRAILTWLGVCEYPRLIKKHETGHYEESSRVYRLLPYCTEHEEIPAPLELDGVIFETLNRQKSIALLRIMVRCWRYYSSQTTFSIRYKYRTWYYHTVSAFWWEQLKTQFIPPRKQNQAASAPLAKCWLPDRETSKAIGELLPTIDLEFFGEDKFTIEKWLIENIGVRRQLSQVAIAEWREFLTTQIPQLIQPTDVERDGSIQKVRRWYEAALESVSAQESTESLANAPLLCRKGEDWKYVTHELRWLADDNELAESFCNDTWQITFSERYHSDAKKIFGLVPLSSAELEPGWDETSGKEAADFQTQLETIKPFVFVWRCYKGSQERDLLRKHLQKLQVRVAEVLQAVTTLDGVEQPKTISKRVATMGHSLLLRKDSANLPLLAEALSLTIPPRSDCDFYENLFRCTNDDERIRKLETRQVPREQIDNLFADYFAGEGVQEQSSEPMGQQPAEIDKTQGKTLNQTNGAVTISDSNTVSSENETYTPSAVQADLSNSNKELEKKPPDTERNPSEVIQDFPKANPLAQTARNRIVLKATKLSEVVFVSASSEAGQSDNRPQRAESFETEPDSESGETYAKPEALSNEDKKEIEKRGREIVTQILESRLGYNVIAMSSHNPGYDLFARKIKEALRVEVKAHLKKASKSSTHDSRVGRIRSLEKLWE